MTLYRHYSTLVLKKRHKVDESQVYSIDFLQAGFYALSYSDKRVRFEKESRSDSNNN